jgi:beta-lactamase superfamily II metal-dependent hydrolase
MGAGICRIIPAMTRALVVAPLVCFLAASGSPADAPRGLDVYWVDVEGGAATLVVTPAGESVLVDTGWDGTRDADRIAAAAQAAGITRIDHLVLTHWHQDHFGGVAEVARRLPIGRFYDHGFPEGAASDISPALKEAYLRVTGGGSTVLRPGDALGLRQAASGPRVSARVLSANGLVEGEPAGAPQTRPCAIPGHEAIPDDTSDNQRSVGLLIAFGDFQLLDTGDLTWNVEHKLACPRDLVGAVDVYQVSHHGLENSNHPVLMRAVSPAVAILNNGPRKGGKAEVYRRLRDLPRPPDVFQLHRNVETTAADNAPPAMVANDDEACQGRWVRLRVDAKARSYTVDVPSKGTTKTYPVRE